MYLFFLIGGLKTDSEFSIWNDGMLLLFFLFLLLPLAVSSGALCPLSLRLSFPWCYQPLRSQNHLSGVAPNPSHHTSSSLQRWRHLSLGLWKAHKEKLHPRGELLKKPSFNQRSCIRFFFLSGFQLFVCSCLQNVTQLCTTICFR